jgi:multidrug efflux pump subunit AcrA (membrane-fusion protein)
VRTKLVELGTVENSVMLGGEVLASSQVSVFPVVGGKLTELRVSAGQMVQRGQVIAMIDPSRPGDSFFQSPVTSPLAGTVLSIPVSVGDTLQTGTAVCVIGDVGRLRLEAFVPERFSVNMRIGLPAQVSFQALPGESFPAEIDEISPVLDPASRTRRIMLRFTGSDNRILAGMFASLSLVTNSRIDVPVIPRQSLINTYGSWIVFVVEGSGDTATAGRRVVETGLESEEMVEITAGLEIGERIVVEGQTFLSDGDPVRVLDSAPDTAAEAGTERPETAEPTDRRNGRSEAEQPANEQRGQRSRP